ncbi:MAG: peroxiredoxin family protein [Pyrinomonadaceae bacterium]
MPSNLRSNIELGAQIVIAVAVVVAAGVLVKRNLFPARGANPGNLPRINAGENLKVPNVDWAQNKKSLVFFLKKDCSFCTASAPFYRQLLDEASKRNVKSLAILPDSDQEAREYITYLKLPIDTVQTGSLEPYKISGTPTVLFVDRQGIVRSVWFGAAREREKEMRDQLVELFDAKE